MIGVFKPLTNASEGALNAITEFKGEYHWLSNFHPSWVWLESDGRSTLFPTVENAYQAAKLLKEKDQLLLVGCDPGTAKQLARRLPTRPGWELRKVEVMLDLLRKKFDPDKESNTPTSSVYNGRRVGAMAYRLICTGDKQLIEGNDWQDIYWGVCKGVGENTLGKLLMQVRSELCNKLQSRID